MEKDTDERQRHNSGASLITLAAGSEYPDRRRQRCKYSAWAEIVAYVLLIGIVACVAIALLIKIQKAEDEIHLNRMKISKYSQMLVAAKPSQNIPKKEKLTSYADKNQVSLLQTDNRTNSVTGNYKALIHVVGKGNGLASISPRVPVHHWKTKVMTGQISLKTGRFIHIRVRGLYFVYSQLQFFWPVKLKQKIRSVVYSIYKNDGDVLKSIIPLKNCITTCTRYHGRLIRLNKGDNLSVQVLQTVTILTKEAVSYFGAFLVMPS